MTNNKIRIQAVLFDYGKVLCHPPLPSDIEVMADICDLTIQQFDERYWHSRLAYDRGDMDVTTYWTNVVAQAEGRAARGIEKKTILSPDSIEKLIALDTESWSRPDPATVQWANVLRQAGFELAVLSNMPLELSRNLVADCEWLAIFDHFTFSCDARSVKPEPKIYQDCLSLLRTPPQQVLFLDDRLENVESAIAAGMQSLVFDNFERTIGCVTEKFDLPVGVEKFV